MSDMEEKKDEFNILDEAQRIVEGKSRPEADAERVVSEAELPEIMRSLGDKTRQLVDIVDQRNADVSNELADGVAKQVSEMGERLDRELDLASGSENPEANKEKAIKEYKFGVRRLGREIFGVLDTFGIKDWPISQAEEDARPTAGNDLIVPLALAKMVYVIHERDEFGPEIRYPDGGVGHPVIDRPRIRSKEERLQIASQAVKGWFLFSHGLGGHNLDAERASSYTKGIIERARNEYIDKPGPKPGKPKS